MQTGRVQEEAEEGPRGGRGAPEGEGFSPGGAQGAQAAPHVAGTKWPQVAPSGSKISVSLGAPQGLLGEVPDGLAEGP